MENKSLAAVYALSVLCYQSLCFGAVPAPIMKFGFENTLADSISATRSAGIDGNVTFENNAPDASGGPVSVRFSGTSPSRVIATNSADLNVNNGASFSIAAWIKTDFNGGDRIIVAKSASSGDLCGARTPALMVDGDGKLRFDNFCVNEVHSAASVRDGLWHHVGLSYNGTTYRLYVDGAPDGVKDFPGSAEGSRGEPAWKFTVGQSLNPTFPTGVFNGNIDDVTFWNVTLTDAQFLEDYSRRAPAVVPGPLAWIDFDNRLDDQSFLGTHDGVAGAGFAFNPNTPNSTAGNASGLFDGNDSRVDLSNSADLNLNTGAAFTITAWIKTDFSIGDRIIAAKSTASGDNCAGGSPAFFVNGSGGLSWDNFCVNAVSSAGTVRNGQWNHVAVTYGGGVYQLYVNGIPDGSKAFGGAAEPAGTWTLVIGQNLNPTYPTGKFRGNIDEVAFWNQKLSAAQVSSVMLAGIHRSTLGITAQPISQTVLAGETATFSVAATVSGQPPKSLRYQWQKNTTDIPGATSASYTTPAATPGDNGAKYRVLVGAPGANPVTSTEATLTVVSPAPAPGALAWIDFENRLEDQSFLGTHDGVAGASFAFSPNTPNATAGSASGLFDGSDSRVDLNSSADLSINSGTTFTISAWIKTDFNDGLRVIVAKSAATGDLCGGHTGALFVDDSGAVRWDNFCVNEVHSSVSVRNGQWNHVAVTFDGGTYRIYVNGSLDGTKAFGGAAEPPGAWTFVIGGNLNPVFPTGRFRGNIDELAFWNQSLSQAQLFTVLHQGIPRTALGITSQPKDRTVLAGKTATFSVTAIVTGHPAESLRYQWQKNTTDIPGATSASYTTPPGDSGSKYRVVVSAPGATALTSLEATLTVFSAVYNLPTPIVWLNYENQLDDQSLAGTHDGASEGGFAFDINTPNSTAGDYSGLFNGTDTRVSLMNSGDLNVNQGRSFTFTAWIKTDFNNGFRIIAAKSAASGNLCGGHTMALGVDDSGNLRFDNFCVNEVHSAAVVRDGQWHHIGMTYDGSTYRLYVDGVRDGTKSFGGSAEGAPGEPPWTFTLGRSLNPTFPTGIFAGNIDEAAFWSQALSDAQMFSLPRQSVPFGLTIARNGNQATILWGGTGFVLQQNADLQNPGGWSDVDGGTSAPFTVNLRAGPTFYRLRRQ